MKTSGPLRARPFSTNTLIVMVAVYVALFANTALVSSALNIYNGGAEEILFTISLLPFAAEATMGQGWAALTMASSSICR